MRSLWCACPTVIDCYTGSWGPCEMVAGHFSNFYFDLGETLGLKFVRACSNNIGELKEFQNASQSTFLFYLVRSASSIATSRTLSLQLISCACARCNSVCACVSGRMARSRRPLSAQTSPPSMSTSRRTRRRMRAERKGRKRVPGQLTPCSATRHVAASKPGSGRSDRRRISAGSGSTEDGSKLF